MTTRLAPGPRVVDLSTPTSAADDGQDLLRGLCRTPREIPTKYGYDGVGSELFEEITRLPDYYLSRLERQLLAGCAAELARMQSWRELVELGSGSSRKTRLLLDEMAGQRVIYTPIDISGPMLAAASADVARRFALNRLEHLNSLFGADFDVAGFEPRSVYHVDRRCVEAQLRAVPVSGIVAGRSISGRARGTCRRAVAG